VRVASWSYAIRATSRRGRPSSIRKRARSSTGRARSPQTGSPSWPGGYARARPSAGSGVALVDDELRRRLEHDGRREAVVGGYQLSVRGGRQRVWDADELEGVVRDLVSSGVLDAGEIAELISREPKVNGRLAASILDRLSGAARDVFAACFAWEARTPGLSIEPVPHQLPEGDAHD
jgi:hypothetical protein